VTGPGMVHSFRRLVSVAGAHRCASHRSSTKAGNPTLAVVRLSVIMRDPVRWWPGAEAA